MCPCQFFHQDVRYKKIPGKESQSELRNLPLPRLSVWSPEVPTSDRRRTIQPGRDLLSTFHPSATHRTQNHSTRLAPPSGCCQNLPLPNPITDSQQPETNPHFYSSSVHQYHGLALLSFLSVDIDGGPDRNDCLSDLSLHIPFIPITRGTRINHLQRQSSNSIVGQERRRTGSAPPAIGRGTHQGDHSRTLRLVWGTGSGLLYRSIAVGRRRSNRIL